MEYLTRKKKSFKRLLFLLLLLLITILIGFYLYLRSSLPPLDGEISLVRLTSPVKIIRDQEGIPHIYAKNKQDLYRAFGFTIASERLFQMEMSRRMANGELAEIIGPKGLASDKMFRTFRLRSSMQEMFDRKIKNGLFNPETLGLMEAFYDGVNQFQNMGNLPIEFKLLNINPRPFTPMDGYSFVGLMSFSFAVATREEPLFSALRARLGDEWVNEMRVDKIPTLSTKEQPRRIVDKTRFFKSSYLTEAMQNIEELGLPLFEGSNGWLIAGKRSASGFPLLSNDPHISYSHPGVWFEAHLKSPDFETYGHFLSNIPFPVLAHNRERGYGFTMSLVDDMDLFREELNPKFKSYRFKDKQLFYKEYLEVIKVKGEADVKMNVLVTQHGPILDEILPEKSLALSWVYYNPNNDPLTSLYNMGNAKSMAEFKAAVSTGVSPGLNVLYADKSNIAWWMFGEIPLRSPRAQSDFIQNGAAGNDEYLGSLAFLQKPHLENPENGIIVSANARPEGFPSDQRGDWQPDDRYQTIKTLLNQKSKWSVDDIKELQTLSFNLENKLILDELLKVSQFDNLWLKSTYTDYFNILKKWDYISSIDSIAPSLYFTWCREISKIILSDLKPEEQKAYAGLSASWIFFKRAVLDPQSIVWTKYDRNKVYKDAFIHTIESLKQILGEDSREWKWGLLHTVEFKHPLGVIPVLGKFFNLGPFGISGSYNDINNQKSSGIEGAFNVSVGPSTRRIIDFAHPERALGILPIGESSHLLSPFYKNQLQRFIAGEYRAELLDDQLINAQNSHELILK